MNGKYVVKIGKYFLMSTGQSINGYSLIVTTYVRLAKTYDLEKANELASKFGGKVMKINLELEEVDEI